MLEIREVAAQILGGNPKSLYFFTGPEYGVKHQYIQELKNHYGKLEEYPNLEELISSLSSKSLIKRPKCVYVVRYDREFLSKLNADYSRKLASLKFDGTIIGIYEDDKSETKLDKHFPDNTVRLNYLTKENLVKHLTRDFSNLSEIHIRHISEMSNDLYKCQSMCKSLSLLDPKVSHSLSRDEFESLFAHSNSCDIEKFKKSIAARNVKIALNELDKFDDDYSMLIYDILSTFIEIAKVFEKKYSDSFVKPYMKVWNPEFLKSMYDLTYYQLEILRNTSTYDSYNALVYIICSLRG